MHVKVRSFVNDPVLSNSTLHTYMDRGSKIWSLTFTTEFSNECLATASASAQYIDKYDHDHHDALRIVLVQQNASSNGCPDIYQPQKRLFRIDMPQDTAINRILLMNYFESSRGWQSDYQIAILHTDAAVDTKPITSYQTLPLQRIAAATATLPLLLNLSARAETETISVPYYNLQFDIQFANHCEADNGIDVYLLESRSDPANPQRDTLYDWLLVLLRNTDTVTVCTNKAKTEMRHFALRRNYHVDYKRKLLILNPLPLATNRRERPFAAMDIQPTW